MERDKRPSWTDADLASLLARYFGEKLSPPHLKRLFGQAVITGLRLPLKGEAEQASAGHQADGAVLREPAVGVGADQPEEEDNHA